MASTRHFKDTSDNSDSQSDVQSISVDPTDDDDGNEHEESSSVASGSGGNFLKFVGNRTSESEMITVEIDLTDPDDLARKLDMVDLTDEETDLLLEKAQQLNIWLRHQLMRQNSSLQSDSVDERHRHSATCIVSAPAAAAATLSDEDEKKSAHEMSVRRARTFSGSSSLPPLVRQPGHTGKSSVTMSYARADPHYPSPYYSRQDPTSAANSRRVPPTLHSVPAKLTANLPSATLQRLDSGTRKSRIDTTE